MGAVQEEILKLNLPKFPINSSLRVVRHITAHKDEKVLLTNKSKTSRLLIGLDSNDEFVIKVIKRR